MIEINFKVNIEKKRGYNQQSSDEERDYQGQSQYTGGDVENLLRETKLMNAFYPTPKELQDVPKWNGNISKETCLKLEEEKRAKFTAQRYIRTSTWLVET